MPRLADELTRMTAAPSARMEPGTVLSVEPGAAADGSPLVTVDWRGEPVPCPYPAGSTFQVGQAVLLLVQGPQVVIVARLIGTPA